MQRDRDDDRNEIRRGERMDAAPRERYGNEEDAYSREYRRAYPEQHLERRLHDDRPYDRPGYEPEAGRPGQRRNVELDRARDQDRGRGQPSDSYRNRYDEQWRSGQGGDPYGYDWEQPAGRREYGNRGYGERGYGGRGQSSRPGQRHSDEHWTDDDWQGGYYGQGRRFGETPSFGERYEGRGGGSSGPVGSQYNPNPSRPSPYDQGDVSSWYGGDTGMGETGSSLDRPTRRGEYGGGQYGGGQYGSQYSDIGSAGRQGQRQWSSGGAGGGFGQPSRGQFIGRGPRGYQRSDERIREDVCELLTFHGDIDASNMDVEVRQGVVTLSGAVDSGRTRRLAEEVVEDIPGVREVENHLRVNRQTGYSGQQGSQWQGDRWQGDRWQGDRWQGDRWQGDQAQAAGQQAGSTPAYGTGVAQTSGASTRSGPGEPGMSAGAGPSQHGNRWQIRDTMDVIGSDGESVGRVKTVRGTDFLVDRPTERDLYVPFSAVQTVDSERVMLSCRASEVDQQNWTAASLAGGA